MQARRVAAGIRPDHSDTECEAEQKSFEMDPPLPEENLQGSHHKYYVEILKELWAMLGWP